MDNKTSADSDNCEPSQTVTFDAKGKWGEVRHGVLFEEQSGNIVAFYELSEQYGLLQRVCIWARLIFRLLIGKLTGE